MAASKKKPADSAAADKRRREAVREILACLVRQAGGGLPREERVRVVRLLEEL